MKKFILLAMCLNLNAFSITYAEVLDMWIDGTATGQNAKMTYAMNMLLDGAPDRHLCDQTLAASYQTIIDGSAVLTAKKQWSLKNYEKMSRKILNKDKLIVQLSCWPQNNK